MNNTLPMFFACILVCSLAMPSLTVLRCELRLECNRSLRQHAQTMYAAHPVDVMLNLICRGSATSEPG